MFEPSHPPVPLVSEEKKLISISVDNPPQNTPLAQSWIAAGVGDVRLLPHPRRVYGV